MTPTPNNIPPALAQLEITLRQMLHEHHALLRAMNEHEAAVRTFAIERIDKATRETDAIRQRIAEVESRRRMLMHQLARQQKPGSPPLTLALLADLFPSRKLVLVGIRTELADLLAQIQMKTGLVAKVSQAVLGHVNATLRLVANAASGPGAYTKTGNTAMPARVGVLNAVA